MDLSPDNFQHFQFSILGILQKNITIEEVLYIENLYKKKVNEYCTRYERKLIILHFDQAYEWSRAGVFGLFN